MLKIVVQDLMESPYLLDNSLEYDQGIIQTLFHNITTHFFFVFCIASATLAIIKNQYHVRIQIKIEYHTKRKTTKLPRWDINLSRIDQFKLISLLTTSVKNYGGDPIIKHKLSERDLSRAVICMKILL